MKSMLLSAALVISFGGERRKFGTHDFLFVPAGVEHRFENLSNDLAVWVFFYGPEGGETPKV
jgi:mannose-6-phosphate isomerase-like protein (cupin superfamily)